MTKRAGQATLFGSRLNQILNYRLKSPGFTSSSYKVVDETDDMPLDDHALIAPLGDDVDPVTQPDGDTDEMSASTRQP